MQKVTVASLTDPEQRRYNHVYTTGRVKRSYIKRILKLDFSDDFYSRAILLGMNFIIITGSLELVIPVISMYNAKTHLTYLDFAFTTLVT